MTVLISGSCNDCGQCCGCETAPNRGSPFPSTWPEAVRNWTIADLETSAPVFRFTGHPNLGGGNYGNVNIGGNVIRWAWVPGVGLVRNKAPWGNLASYHPECPALDSVQPDGTYPCLVVGTQYEDILTAFGCRWLPETLSDAQWAQWIGDHPGCSFVATPV